MSAARFPVPPSPGSGREQALSYLRECVSYSGCAGIWWLFDPVLKSGSILCQGPSIGIDPAISFFLAIDPDVSEVEVESAGAHGRLVSRWTPVDTTSSAVRSSLADHVDPPTTFH